MQRMRISSRASRKRQSGVAAIEFAFIAPVLIVMFVGMIDVVHYLNAIRRLNYAAFLVSDLVTREGPTIQPATLTDIFIGARLALRPLNMTGGAASDVRIDVYDFRTGGIPVRWSRNSASGTACNVPPTPPSLTAANDLVVVVICMTYTPPRASILNFANLMGFETTRIEQQVTARPRQTATLTCNPSGVTC